MIRLCRPFRKKLGHGGLWLARCVDWCPVHETIQADTEKYAANGQYGGQVRRGISIWALAGGLLGRRGRGMTAKHHAAKKRR